MLDPVTSRLCAFEDGDNLLERIDDIYVRLDKDGSGARVWGGMAFDARKQSSNSTSTRAPAYGLVHPPLVAVASFEACLLESCGMLLLARPLPCLGLDWCRLWLKPHASLALLVALLYLSVVVMSTGDGRLRDERGSLETRRTRAMRSRCRWVSSALG